MIQKRHSMNFHTYFILVSIKWRNNGEKTTTTTSLHEIIGADQTLEWQMCRPDYWNTWGRWKVENMNRRGGGWGSAFLGKLRPSQQKATILGPQTLLPQQARQDSVPVCSSKDYSLSVSLHRWTQKKVSLYRLNFERMCSFIVQKKFLIKICVASS